MRYIIYIIASLIITSATTIINPNTDERAMYGHEGKITQNWLPRKVAGWPAPFIADNPNTSVIHNVGVEDVFRLGPFIATLSFWFLFVSTISGIGRGATRKLYRKNRSL